MGDETCLAPFLTEQGYIYTAQKRLPSQNFAVEHSPSVSPPEQTKNQQKNIKADLSFDFYCTFSLLQRRTKHKQPPSPSPPPTNLRKKGHKKRLQAPFFLILIFRPTIPAFVFAICFPLRVLYLYAVGVGVEKHVLWQSLTASPPSPTSLSFSLYSLLFLSDHNSRFFVASSTTCTYSSGRKF